MKKAGILSVLLVAVFALSAIPELVSTEERWVPVMPHPDSVELTYWSVRKVAYVNVTITFPVTCYKFDWGTVSREDEELWADSKIWTWTGMCGQLETIFRHTYELGKLKHKEEYTFTFKAWGTPVKSITFEHLKPR